jgi:hypothetical protein
MEVTSPVGWGGERGVREANVEEEGMAVVEAVKCEMNFSCSMLSLFLCKQPRFGVCNGSPKGCSNC